MGGEAGIRKLVDHFYDVMSELPEAKTVLAMHPDLPLSREKLTVFLTGWLGGPKRYSERWGPIRIPAAHAHLPIGQAEHDAWLACMDGAVERMSIPEDFKAYFKREIRVPAGRVLSKTACPHAPA
ncbi:MAG TPA: globin [Nannocystis exedens]|nr:globin [Nannocystis exedens]